MLIKEFLAIRNEKQHVEEAYKKPSHLSADIKKVSQHLKSALAIINSENWADFVEASNHSIEDFQSIHDNLYKLIDESISIIGELQDWDDEGQFSVNHKANN